MFSVAVSLKGSRLGVDFFDGEREMINELKQGLEYKHLERSDNNGTFVYHIYFYRNTSKINWYIPSRHVNLGVP